MEEEIIGEVLGLLQMNLLSNQFNIMMVNTILEEKYPNVFTNPYIPEEQVPLDQG